MLEAFALSDVGRVRTNNEDCCLILPEIGLYLLADGMGGARAGEMASRLAVDTVAEVVQNAWQRDPPNAFWPRATRSGSPLADRQRAPTRPFCEENLEVLRRGDG